MLNACPVAGRPDDWHIACRDRHFLPPTNLRGLKLKCIVAGKERGILSKRVAKRDEELKLGTRFDEL